MDGWCVNAGMDDWLPSEPVKPEERVPRGGGVGGSRAAAASSQNQPKRNPSFLFYRNVLCACARSLSTSALFPRLARTFLFLFFCFGVKTSNCPISEECDFNTSVSLSVWRRGFSAEVTRVHHETVDCV